MNRRQWVTIFLGVLVLHAALFWFIADKNPLPKIAHTPRPSFVAQEAKWVDEATGERMVVREFSVSTRLALPDALMERKPHESSAP